MPTFSRSPSSFCGYVFLSTQPSGSPGNDVAADLDEVAIDERVDAVVRVHAEVMPARRADERVRREIAAVEHLAANRTLRPLRGVRPASLPRRMRSHSGIGIIRCVPGTCRAVIELAQLLEVVEDLALIELRLADDAIGEDVRNLDRASVVRLRDHLETDLETDRIEFDAVERVALDQEVAAGDIFHGVSGRASAHRDERRDLAPPRPVLDAAARDVAATDREAVLTRLAAPRPSSV